jgi:deoxycytidine triphosphate deaminase
MARILSDREIKSLFGSVIQGADEHLLNPNGIELRLGNRVKFISTGEEKEIPAGYFVKVSPGESVIIASLEKLDFSKKTVQKHFQNCMLMALITPTTTMIREGIMQAATKVDAGFIGNLNWGFRNSSFKDFKMQNGESIFKLTFFLLEGNEVPSVNYGDKPEHKYQNTEGVLSSVRRLPVDIPDQKIVGSSFEKLDPKKQLREAGHPFSYIGSELVSLHGKWEIVSTDVKNLTNKIDEAKSSVLEKVDSIFEKKVTTAVVRIVGAISVLYGILMFLQKTSLSSNAIAILAIIAGVGLPTGLWYLRKR